MTLQAIPAIARVENLVEVGRVAAKTVDGVFLSQLLARVDAMDHPLEGNRLGRILVRRAPVPVVRVGVVADVALLDCDALAAVREGRGETVVAGVALVQGYDQPASD